MKILILLSITLFVSCSKKPSSEIQHSDDYVLIEFAAKLEEENQIKGPANEK